MCTFFTLASDDFFVGRNMDIECSFGEQLVVTPRNYPWSWRYAEQGESHYALIGMATVMDGMPLYAEAANEYGLTMAGLNFPENATYGDRGGDGVSLTPFELIPYILTRFRNIHEAEGFLKSCHLINEPFKEEVPLAPLHFILADKEQCLVLEPRTDGLHIYDNPTGVLTNNPPFPHHLVNIENYANLQVMNPSSTLLRSTAPTPYGQGLGSVGLPGDASPMSRFVRAAFYKNTSAALENRDKNMMQVFHILDAVKMLKGSVMTPTHQWDITTYSACINATKGIYYFKTYENPQIYQCDLFAENLDGRELIAYDLPAFKEPESLQKSMKGKPD
ncbi:MAG: choloylglycine hydrolase [Eubacteriales bacterium]|nr:choloylglycine hydrolase [Eubacteriales bacterium]